MGKVKLVECFQSFQGEGPNSGRNCLILRYKRCNRIQDNNKCLWCDTAVKLRISQEFEMSTEEIHETISKLQCGLLITGGEPTYNHNFEWTCDILNNVPSNYIDIETNGYRLLEMAENYKNTDINFIYSPKIFNEKEFEENLKIIQEASYNPNIYLKIVCDKNNSFLRILLNDLDKLNINERVYLMPEGVTRDELIANSGIVFDYAEEFHFNFSSRDHVIYNFI